MTKSLDCKKHSITWDYGGIDVDTEADCVRFEGKCSKCTRRFMKTYVDARYSVMELNSNEWQNYELLGTEDLWN